MSEENPQEILRLNGEQDSNSPEHQSADDYDFILDKTTNELTIKDPTTGRIITFKAKIKEKEVEEEDEKDKEEESKPLTPDDFREVLRKMDALGLGWTADLQPSVRAKTPEAEESLLSDEFLEIQQSHPTLPRELGVVVFHALTGSKAPEIIVGSADDLTKKVAAVHEFIIDTNYRSEFFFKHAIKIPYLTDIDWEVVFKLGEKNVEGLPAISYAILSLLFHKPSLPGKRATDHEAITVAVNDYLVDKLIKTLTDVKSALEQSKKLADAWSERSKLKGEENARTTDNQEGLG